MTRWAAFRRRSIGLNWKPEVLPCSCLIDRGAYIPISAFYIKARDDVLVASWTGFSVRYHFVY
jgi:hypothetical protein